MTATGRVDGADVVVDDSREATRLYNKAGAGTMESGNVLRLSHVEAAHAVAQGWLDVDADTEALLADDARYVVYADLRSRGLHVRHDGDSELVWKRGESPPAEPWFRVTARSERDPLRAHDVVAADGGVLAFVDEDGAVTYYEADQQRPSGAVPMGALPEVTGRLLTDRFLVEPSEPALAAEGLGTIVADKQFLSLMEAEHLRRRGSLRTDSDIAAYAEARQHHFTRTLPAFEALRAAGIVAKSGFRFGTHLRAYDGPVDAGHAPWLVHCVRPDDDMHSSEISRAVRLAHGVRKTFLLAVVDEPVRFYALAWFRP